MALERAATRTARDVVDDEGGLLPDRVRLRDVDLLAGGIHLEVVHHGKEARDLGGEVVLVDDSVRLEIEGEETRLTPSVVGVVEGPEPTLAVDAEGEDRLVALLEGRVGIWRGLSPD